jgi:hypothetical protein
MKKQTSQNLPAFIIVLIIAVLTFNSSCSKIIKIPIPVKTTPDSAKIVYTDVNPDTTISASWASINPGIITRHYNIDLDKDGTDDFQFEVQAGKRRNGEEGGYVAFSFVFINTILNGDTNKVATDSGRVLVLDSLAVIDSASATWLPGNKSLVSAGITWSGDTAYVGLRLVKATAIYYGWVRLSNVVKNVPFAPSTITIMDYAYNSIPNQPIRAGQTK